MTIVKIAVSAVHFNSSPLRSPALSPAQSSAPGAPTQHVAPSASPHRQAIRTRTVVRLVGRLLVKPCQLGAAIMF